MAEYVVMPKSDYIAACDAIREKTGTTDPIKSSELGDLIRGIVGGGIVNNTTSVLGRAVLGKMILGKVV